VELKKEVKKNAIIIKKIKDKIGSKKLKLILSKFE
tara:strand:+ start:78 stop:182 length:105 start_codon:yes stop_codon:yes gene_type:complete